jgi:hypothetical protein
MGRDTHPERIQRHTSYQLLYGFSAHDPGASRTRLMTPRFEFPLSSA